MHSLVFRSCALLQCCPRAGAAALRGKIVYNMLSTCRQPSANSSRRAVAACQVLALLNALTGKTLLQGVQTEANC